MLAHVVEPGSVWRAWGPDPVETGILLGFVLLYLRGAFRLRQSGPRRVLPTRRIVAVVTGVGLAVAALASPLDGLADTLFAWHMVQHLVLLLVVPPLVVWGRPLLVLGFGLPQGLRRRVQRIAAAAPARGAIRAVVHPAVAWGLYAVALWGWHLPGPYQAAVHDDVFHALEHASFLGAALLFWSVVIGAGPRRRLSYGGTLLFTFTTMLHSVWLAMVLSFVPTVVYPVYATGTAAWGIEALADQHAGGTIMWVPSALVFIVTLAVLFLRWLRDIGNRIHPRDIPTPRAEPTRSRP